MFVRNFLVTLFAVLGAVAQASDVVVLGVDNFDDIVSASLPSSLPVLISLQTQASTGENGNWMVKFYAPW
jgi:hypothetical protein